MFFFNSFRPGSFRQKITRNVFTLFALFCLSAFLLLAGCSTEPDEGNLHGTWVNVFRDPAGELPDFITTIKINTSIMTIEYVGDYEGTIINNPDFSAVNGVIIIRFTKYGDWGEEPTLEHENVGKYGALYWRDLGLNSVRMADAFIGFDRAMFNTIGEAQINFTMDKASDYIDWSIIGIYTR